MRHFGNGFPVRDLPVALLAALAGGRQEPAVGKRDGIDRAGMCVDGQAGLSLSRPEPNRPIVRPRSQVGAIGREGYCRDGSGVVELSKQYSILVNTNGHVVMFAAVVGGIYLALSLPLSRLAHILERRLDAGLSRGRAA